MKNRTLLYLFLAIASTVNAQNNTFSPYSRYGLGELSDKVFSHNLGMGGAHIALKPDSTMPVFINPGNPASYALIRLTTLEVGGRYNYSTFSGDNMSVKRWGTNFSYGSLGFPLGPRGGASFGVMPYSSVGYETESRAEERAGTMTYRYNGAGGLTKAYLGYGLMPFRSSNTKFRSRHMYVPDSVKTLSRAAFKMRDFGTHLLSDFSAGFNVNYIFGNIQNTARVIYPDANLYNNTYTEKVVTLSGFTGNFGAQTAITFDSVPSLDGRKRLMKEKVKLTFGYFMSLNNSLNGNFNTVAYNYLQNSVGEELIRDTALYNIDQPRSITLPLEQGFGIGFKKGERINLVADFALTNWQNFRFLDEPGDLKDNYRIGAGISFVPEKYAAGQGAFFKRIHYRFGLSYESGYIQVKNTLVSDYSISAGLGLPVGIGRLSSMINISARYGQMGTTAGGLMAENYWRIHFGFTFCDRWFQKYRYD